MYKNLSLHTNFMMETHYEISASTVETYVYYTLIVYERFRNVIRTTEIALELSKLGK